MNESIKSLLIFCAGVVAGGLVANIYLKTKYEELVDDEIASIREHLLDKKDNVVESEFTDEERSIYNQIIEEEQGYIFQDMPASADIARSAGDILIPYVITLEQFSEECDEYDKITLLYYLKDCAYTDEENNIILDTAYIIGDAGEQAAASSECVDDPIYIRNNKIEIDYEIRIVNDSYAEAILGVDPEPVEPKKKRRKNESQD